ncbi:MAG: prepilin-type N-terminal cleavage/methylation domain-containing protein [Chitinispirillaceae bacterium]|nr:prepilin-type N-terminal cleavage/methylation domain-containing protein [Chitinispirillaceae bacterium]
MKNIRGFTLIEVSMIMVILGILSLITFFQYKKSMAHNQLEKAANNLYCELRSMKSLSFKYDGQVKATFNTSLMQCSIWVDTSQGGSFKYQSIMVYQIPSPIVIGRPDADLAQPYTDGWWTYHNPYPSIVNGVQGEWKDSIKIVPDSLGEYNHGGIYLHNPQLEKTYYFIGINSGMQFIELKKCTGDAKSWNTL